MLECTTCRLRTSAFNILATHAVHGKAKRLKFDSYWSKVVFVVFGIEGDLESILSHSSSNSCWLATHCSIATLQQQLRNAIKRNFSQQMAYVECRRDKEMCCL